MTGQSSRPADFSRQTQLAEWMTAHIAGYRGPFSIEQFLGGQSNPTYKLVTPHHVYVLRSKPAGQILSSAHAIEREARAMTALGSIGFPVPRILGFCSDETVLGTSFFVMEMVEGRVFSDAALPEVARSNRAAYFETMNDTIARLHTADYRAIGLHDYGRPGNYLQRQINRWSKQYLADTDAGRDPLMDKLIDCLSANLPSIEQKSTIVHGDFRWDNLIFHPTEPRIVAVVDWELSTIGDPLGDFSYNAMMYRLPGRLFTGIADRNLAELNIPCEQEYIARYCQNTGRSNIPNYNFYIAFNLFRLAAIFHGIKGRLIRGSAVSPRAAEIVRHLPELLNLGWEQMQLAIG